MRSTLSPKGARAVTPLLRPETRSVDGCSRLRLTLMGATPPEIAEFASDPAGSYKLGQRVRLLGFCTTNRPFQGRATVGRHSGGVAPGYYMHPLRGLIVPLHFSAGSLAPP